MRKPKKPAKELRKAKRKAAFTPDSITLSMSVAATIITHVAKGVPYLTVCRALGIPRSMANLWKAAGQEIVEHAATHEGAFPTKYKAEPLAPTLYHLYRGVEQAEAELLAQMAKGIWAEAKGMQAGPMLRWLAERLDPETYGGASTKKDAEGPRIGSAPVVQIYMPANARGPGRVAQ